MRDGTVAAIGRDAVKDVRSTLMQVFFGNPDRGGEAGTPLNPLFHDIVEARKSHGSVHGAGPQSPHAEKGSQMSSMSNNQSMPTPSQVIANPTAYLPQQGNSNGNAMAME